MRQRIGCGVAVAIAVVAVGLLLPAVRKVREAANRATCLGHLGQLGRAHHGAADAPPAALDLRPGWFLPGTVPNLALPPDRRLSWAVPVLLFVDQEERYRRFDLTAAADDEANHGPAADPVRVYLCPSSTEHSDVRVGRPAEPLLHYAGVAGVGEDAATLPAGHPRAGVFGYDRRTRRALDGIPDGLSSTLLLAEARRGAAAWAVGGPGTVRGVEPDRPFGGFHPGGCTVAMADGSVRFLADATAPEVWEALATVGGREELPNDW